MKNIDMKNFLYQRRAPHLMTDNKTIHTVKGYLQNVLYHTIALDD